MQSEEEFRAEIDRLRHRLEEAEETIRAIQGGGVDAFVVTEGEQQRIYTLEGADRPYRLLVEEMQQGAATLQADGVIIYANRQLIELLGVAHGKLTGQLLSDFITPSGRGAFAELIRACPENSGVAELVLETADGQIHALVTCNALPEESGASIGVLITDLTSQKHHEHLKVLVDELNHRVKNTLAFVQSIAQQTLRGTDSPERFVADFSGRVQALARVHTMLSETTWQGLDMSTLVRDQTAIGLADDSRFSAHGPPIMLNAQLALHLAMVLHELGTNAIKYGALSQSSGHVDVSWKLERGIVRLSWSERGGPTVTAPARRGFGSVFIEMTIRSHGGEAVMHPERSGIVWRITLPLKLASSESRSARALIPVETPDKSFDISVVTLKGKRVLVIEDEALVAMTVMDILELAEAQPLGPAASVAEAMTCIETGVFDAALVDANLQGTRVDAIATALKQRNVPFVFVTGYDRTALPSEFQDTPLLSKPFTDQALILAVKHALGRSCL